MCCLGYYLIGDQWSLTIRALYEHSVRCHIYDMIRCEIFRFVRFDFRIQYCTKQNQNGCMTCDVGGLPTQSQRPLGTINIAENGSGNSTNYAYATYCTCILYVKRSRVQHCVDVPLFFDDTVYDSNSNWFHTRLQIVHVCIVSK